MRRCFLAVLLITPAASQVFWWHYPKTDAPNNDIEEAPCKANCTVEQLENYCIALPTCVAFNTHGWLKNAASDVGPCKAITHRVTGLYPGPDSDNPSPTPSPSPPPPPPIWFWPIPVSLKMGPQSLIVSPSLSFVVSPPNASAPVVAYASRLARDMFAHAAKTPIPPTALDTVNIVVENPSAALQLGVDESYTLFIPSDGSPATINASTIFGAYMGLQTLSQAVRFNFDTEQYGVAAAPLAVEDAPKFPWRGILVDSDRHWLSPRELRRIIDALGYTKLNVLHWHIVDWDSWPLESPSYPTLWTAAWSERERYTLADVSGVIAYASERGVRVVLEFDTPGHASSLCHAFRDLCCTPANCGWGPNSPLTPVPDALGRNVSLDVIEAVLGELAAISPDDIIHLGGDEAHQGCWQNDSAVLSWMQTQGMGNDTNLVYKYFVESVDAMAFARAKTPVRWEEVWAHFGTLLDPQTIIQAWLSPATIINVTSHGYRALFSMDNTYYLDSLDEMWQVFYDQDIIAGISNATQAALVLGGETAMWGETVDGSDQLQTIFPRAAAAAERQWSYSAVTNSSAPYVEARLQAFRCFLLERGIPAAPLSNAVARSAPVGPGSCLDQ